MAFKHENTVPIRPVGLTLDELRSRASGLHFAKGMLSKGELEILSLLESALNLIDSDAVTLDATKL